MVSGLRAGVGSEQGPMVRSRPLQQVGAVQCPAGQASTRPRRWAIRPLEVVARLDLVSPNEK